MWEWFDEQPDGITSWYIVSSPKTVMWEWFDEQSDGITSWYTVFTKDSDVGIV